MAMTMTMTMNDEAQAELKFSLKRERVERLNAIDVKRANGGLGASEVKAREVAELRLFGAGASPRRFARLEAQQVDGVLRGQYRFSGGFSNWTPIQSRSPRTQRRPVEARLQGHPLRVNAADLPRRQFLHLAAGAAALPAVSRVARRRKLIRRGPST
jgi:hypothetical protein